MPNRASADSMPDALAAPSTPLRHDEPAIDEAALQAARRAEVALDAARATGNERWAAFLAPLPERLRDDPVATLRSAVLRARAAYGPKDSIRDALPRDVTEPLLDSLDRLLRALNRRDVRPR